MRPAFAAGKSWKPQQRALNLGLQINLNMAAFTELLPHAPQAAAKAGANKAGSEIIAAARTDCALPDAVLRLLQLPDAPQDIAALSGLILREIYYRLLRGSQGAYLARMAQPEGHAARIAKAISLIKDRPAEPLKVSALAEQAGMIISSFHACFKQITGFLPRQYQKYGGWRKRAGACQNTAPALPRSPASFGWQSASQFSREYIHLFGISPKQDLEAAQKAYKKAEIQISPLRLRVFFSLVNA